MSSNIILIKGKMHNSKEQQLKNHHIIGKIIINIKNEFQINRFEDNGWKWPVYTKNDNDPFSPTRLFFKWRFILTFHLFCVNDGTDSEIYRLSSLCIFACLHVVLPIIRRNTCFFMSNFTQNLLLQAITKLRMKHD